MALSSGRKSACGYAATPTCARNSPSRLSGERSPANAPPVRTVQRCVPSGCTAFPEEAVLGEHANETRRNAHEQVIAAAPHGPAGGGRPGRTGDVVRTLGGRIGLKRLGMDLEEVIALHGVQDGDLPVARPCFRRLQVRVVVQLSDAPRGHERLDRCDTRRNGLHVGVEGNEDKPVPGLHAIRGQAVRRPVDRLVGRIRRAKEPAVGVVGPGMVGTLDALGVRRLLDKQRAAMGAQIGQGRQLARLTAHEEYGLIADPHGNLVARCRERVLGRCEDPVPHARCDLSPPPATPRPDRLRQGARVRARRRVEPRSCRIRCSCRLVPLALLPAGPEVSGCS